MSDRRHFLRPLTKRRSKLVESRDKVYLRNESFVWIPKSRVFVKLQEVGVLSYSGLSLSKGHSIAMRCSSDGGAD